jgi:diguanylate cyclase (GGDEF)-like protein
LWLDSLKEDAFSNDDLEKIEPSFVSWLSGALVHFHRLNRALSESTRLQGFLGDLKQIAASPSQEALMELLERTLARHFHAHRVMCLALLPANKTRVLFVSGDEQEFWAGRIFPLDPKSLFAVPLLEGEPIQKDFPSDDPKFYACRVHEHERHHLRMKSLLAVPVCSLQEPCLVLSLESRTPHAYADEDELLLECLAGGAGAALSRIQALREREERKTDDALTCAKLLSPMMEWAQERPEKCAAMLAGIDNLMDFNANYGFTAGDEALRAFAQLLSNASQELPECRLARYGADTFLLVQKNGLVTDFQILAERLRKAWNQAPFHLTASFAVGSLTENSFPDLERTLYLAKSQGKNKVLKAPSP